MLDTHVLDNVGTGTTPNLAELSQHASRVSPNDSLALHLLRKNRSTVPKTSRLILGHSSNTVSAIRRRKLVVFEFLSILHSMFAMTWVDILKRESAIWRIGVKAIATPDNDTANTTFPAS